MWVHPKQLVPGCKVVNDVMGKTNNPILPKNTVIQDEHIQVLQSFLVPNVEVSPRLAHGAPFIPKELSEEEREITVSIKRINKTPMTFEEQYVKAVERYKYLFHHWQSGTGIDINKVREFIVPLLERVDEVGLDLFLLHKYASKEDYFYHHGIAISLISGFIAKKRGYKKEWIQVGLAGMLADSGMAKISTSLFNKTGPLVLPEYEEIKKHPTFSYRLVEKIPSLTTGAKLAILQHHERIDGSGYPLGVDKRKIHPYASIIAISDTYHAMTSERVYQPKQSPYKVIEEMIHDQFNKYDHEVLHEFIKSLANFSTGTKVLLSNKTKAEIVFVDPKHLTRPMVKIDGSNEIVSLQNKPSIYIEEILAE
ncbi:HD-GYP domain-containing protein [Aquibacillus koreensis]|uniref:HD-GYP domain-containing protein n=1 Tax=Aquibacillus koreensis TaxID=279446 RepID=A0A9X3WSR1_9BACI|nr:HD-GYP domain-containing protein [Aquibacillus koreensis]MCT2535513.1 HD-GYP domain-containing protein [Aquibacillus koreensis]MDC3422744.1 HD-GYP domain-containing protein [Aquibacillus koreensis]